MMTSFFLMNSYTPIRLISVASRLVSSLSSRAIPCSGVSSRSIKPVIKAKVFSGQATFRASSILPSISTSAAHTGKGLSQCVQCPSGQLRRFFCASCSSLRNTKSVAQRGQDRMSIRFHALGGVVAAGADAPLNKSLQSVHCARRAPCAFLRSRIQIFYKDEWPPRYHKIPSTQHVKRAANYQTNLIVQSVEQCLHRDR